MKIDLYSRYPELEVCGEQIEKVLEMMKATYDNGVLKLEMPKKALPDSARHIEIE